MLSTIARIRRQSSLHVVIALIVLVMFALLPARMLLAEDEKDFIDEIRDFGFHLFVDTSIVFFFDAENKDFEIDQAEIYFEREFFDFLTVRVDFDYVPERGPDEFRFEQAHVVFNLDSVIPGMDLLIGKSNFHLGLEGNDPPDLYQYSYADVSNYPENFSGVMLGLQVSQWVKLYGLAFTGGDQDYEDNNDSFSFGGVLEYVPIEGMEFYTGFTYGPEKDNNDDDNSFVISAHTHLEFIEDFIIGAEVQYGTEDGLEYTDGKATWYGGLFMINYSFLDNFSGTIRIDYFRDDGGALTGVDQELIHVTGALLFEPVKTINFILEAKFSSSDKPIFLGEDSTLSNHQFSVSLELLFSI